jgi:hypothetical protein
VSFFYLWQVKKVLKAWLKAPKSKYRVFLMKKGRKRIVEVCFFDIVGIKIEVGHGGLSGLPSLYMFDDCRAGWWYKFLRGEADR